MFAKKNIFSFVIKQKLEQLRKVMHNKFDKELFMQKVWDIVIGKNN